MYNLFFSPRFPRGMSAELSIFTSCFLQAAIVGAIGSLLALFGFFVGGIEPEAARALAGVAVFVIYMWSYYRIASFRFTTAVEFAVGGLLVFAGMTEFPIGLVPLIGGMWIMVRARSEGPEPDGWGPKLAALKAAKELKSRRE